MTVGYIGRNNSKIIELEKVVDVLFISNKLVYHGNLENAISICKDGDNFIIDKLSDVADTVDELKTFYDGLSNKNVNLQIMTEEASLVIWRLLLESQEIKIETYIQEGK